MYRAFNLPELENLDELKNIDIRKAQAEYNQKKAEIAKQLSIDKILESATYTEENNGQVKINADDIQKKIFPTYKDYDVFLSHSHKDLNLVQKFAYYLTNNMGLKVFIDSEVWGYVDDLLEGVNDRYASIGEKLYDYNIVNIDASNIYLMLSNAIHDVINETECLFFINTPNSIDINDNIKSKSVESPWIYDELKTTSMIKRRIPDYMRGYLDAQKARENTNLVTDSVEPKWIRDVNREIDGLTILNNEALLKWNKKNITSHSVGDRVHSMLNFYSMLYEESL